jgi:hypothetical protein
MTDSVLATHVDDDDTLYVNVKDCGILPMVIAIDGLQITRFGDEEVHYLLFDEVVDWHRANSKDTTVLEALLKIRAKFRAGKIDVREDYG